MDLKGWLLLAVVVLVGAVVGFWGTWLTLGLVSVALACVWAEFAFTIGRGEHPSNTIENLAAVGSVGVTAAWFVAVLVRPIFDFMHTKVLIIGLHDFIR